MNDTLVQQFVFKDENILTVGEEMAGTNNVYMNGLNGDKHPGNNEAPEKSSKRTIQVRPIKSPTKRQSPPEPKNINKSESTINKANEQNESKPPVPVEEEKVLAATEKSIQIHSTVNASAENQVEPEQSSQKDTEEKNDMLQEDKTQKESQDIDVPAPSTEEQHITPDKVTHAWMGMSCFPRTSKLFSEKCDKMKKR